MVIKNLLLATQAGLGNGETPIFPVQIFKVKEGINYNPDDPNYDLFKLAMETSAKRLFPNFSFLDAPFNKAFYTKNGDWNHEVAYMGCRTRVMANVDKEHEVTCGRGNLSFTTINLPRLGIIAGEDHDLFFKLLDDRIDLVIRQLLHRYKIQGRRKVKNYPFLMGNGIWIDSDKLDWDDPIESVIKHGTLTIGFIGLAECLVALTGKHHGESDSSQELGLKIIGHMRKRCDEATAEHQLNFSLIATPSESTCFAKGTLVQGLHGNKPIEEVKPGDVLFSYNEDNGRIELDTVEKCWMTSPSRKVVKITFADGKEIICTPEHLFGREVYSGERNEHIIWTRADKLNNKWIKSAYFSKTFKEVTQKIFKDSSSKKNINEFVESCEQCSLFINKFSTVVAKVEEMDEPCEVWDITMSKNHTFYVGEDQGILVHNCGKFPPLDRKRFGEIPGINDRLYYTNSFHVPVYYPIKAFKKIEIEAPYHEFTNGGHITYVELDGNTANNLPAFEKIIRYMHDKGVGYGSINHPVDRDPICGYVGVIGDICPRCGRKEGEPIDVEKLRELRKKFPNVPKY